MILVLSPNKPNLKEHFIRAGVPFDIGWEMAVF